MAVFSKLYNALRADVKSTGNAGETELDMKCIRCSRKERLLRFVDLNKGDHICRSGQYLVINIGERQVSAYTHHAIVKSVQVLSGSTASVTLIHFYTTPQDPVIRIQETTELLNLLYYEIYIIRYRHKTHTPETIIARAEGLMELNKNAKYSIFSCNCEHFCNWCCVGSEESYQADNARDVFRGILAGVANIGGKVLRVVCKLLLLSFEDLSKVAAGALIVMPWGVLAVMAILYLIYTLYRHDKLDKDFKAGKFCTACCLRQKHDLWIQFVAYCGLQVGGLGLLSLIISAGASGGIVVGALVACSLLSLVCISAVPRLRKMFCSPFQGRLVRVNSMKNIWIGDVISFDHWKISHDGIVSSVKIQPGTRKKKGEVTVIHYSLPSLFGRRTVIEETIEVDLGKHLILGHDYTGYKVHKPELVVKRARKRIGEAKFGIMSNRSCHFCHWAKVNEDLKDEDTIFPDSSPELHFLYEVDPKDTISNLPSQSIHIDHKRGRKHATKTIGKTWARIRDDIQPGQIIQFKYRGFLHKTVTTSVHFDKHRLSKVSVTVVHYGRRSKVCEETFSVDLNHQDVWIHKYHPLYRFKKADIIRRARARIGEENYNLFLHRSSHLAREIVVKDINVAVTDIDEIKRGDVITFYYWTLKHDAVVTKVVPDDSKANTTGKLKIVHYALDNLFSVRTVKEETMNLNLKKELVYLKSYEGYITYPGDQVVKRARTRVGEQRFSPCGNTSSDLAHWAKVVQHPVVIAKSPGDASPSASRRGEKYLLVPKAGDQSEEFQSFRVTSWSDLYPGVIVEYRYYWIWHQGILSYKNEGTKEVRVIHYGADHIFATRTITEDTLKLDLRYDNIWMYRGHPRKCYKAEVVLENARKRLGEQMWCKGNRSWDFCKDCVLKKRSKEV